MRRPDHCGCRSAVGTRSDESTAGAARRRHPPWIIGHTAPRRRTGVHPCTTHESTAALEIRASSKYLEGPTVIWTDMPHLGHVHAATTSVPQRRKTDWDRPAPHRRLVDRLRWSLRRRRPAATRPTTPAAANHPSVPARARPVMQIVRSDGTT
jgi:hypothetical protein